MLQSTHFDPVLGLDTHIVGIPAPPAPAPIPTPIPMPFVGMVFDPLGVAIGAAIGMVTGGHPGLVLVNSIPVTNCGTAVTNKMTMPHLPAPGVMFIPPPAPSNDALLYFGSLNVTLGGSYGVRLGDIALSCNDPVRLPTSVVMAIPKGPPVLNMPPMVPDLKAIAMAIAMHGLMKGLGALARRGAALFRRLRAGSAFFQSLSEKLGGCHPPDGASRWRQMWSRAVRSVTGHPVDVVTGNLFTSAIDVELPGPLPLIIERVYESAGSEKSGALGYGWGHSLDETLWMERGRAVVRCGDGREIEFPLWDLRDRTMRPGDVLERVIHKMTLRCASRGLFEVEHADGRVHEFASVPGGDATVLHLVRIRSRDNHHAIHLTYDRRGRLDGAIDSTGRSLKFEHDERGRLVAIHLPRPSGQGWYAHRKYGYGVDGDLETVEDALGHRWRYLYRSHLLVQETDRRAFSFYFQYDGVSANAKCIRTWGDGGRYDHVITYDTANRKTIVEDSLGATTLYSFNIRNQVTSTTDAHGKTCKFEYDPDTGGRTIEVDPLGAKIARRFDAAGNLVEVTAASGAKTRMEYQRRDLVRAIDARGSEWRWTYDRAGHLIESTPPLDRPTIFGWEHGLLVSRRDPSGGRTSFEYDERKTLVALRFGQGGGYTYKTDNVGHVIELRNAVQGATHIEYDLEGRIVATQNPAGANQRLAYDAEGDLLEAFDETKRLRLVHAGGRIVRREEATAATTFEWDTEGRLVAVVNEMGERYVIGLDAVGRVREEIGFDGRKRVYTRDAAGRVTKLSLPSGRSTETTYDPAGRPQDVKHSDGTFAHFEYDPGGLAIAAENESGRVEMEYDAAWRLTTERANDQAVQSAYGPDGERAEMQTSLGARVAIRRSPDGRSTTVILGRPSDPRVAPDVLFERDVLGMEHVRRHANGVDVEWRRDAAGRTQTRSVLQRLGPSLPPSGNGEAAPSRERELEAAAYQWRGDDQIARIVDPSTGPRVFDHDDRGRLVRERSVDGAVERRMDPAGNVFRTLDGSDRRYAKGGRLEVADGARYQYDEDGNQTAKIEADGRTWRYHWNGHGALREIEQPDGARLQMEYDPFVRRTMKRTLGGDGVVRRATTFVWDGHVVVHELDSEQGLKTWTWEPGMMSPIAKEQGGRRWTITSDHLGTPAEMYDELGALVWKMQLDVFGVPRLRAGAAGDCPWRWPGQYEDAETGFYYNRTRYYDRVRGSFLSHDPAGLQGGLNPYSYVFDPLTWIDLLGLTGTYIFQFPGGETYIGKGPVDRAMTSQRIRAAEVGSNPSAITQGAFKDYGKDKMGLMVEAEMMRRNNFGSNPNLLNAINSPGEKLLQSATAAEKAAVTRNANALEQAFLQSTGKIC